MNVVWKAGLCAVMVVVVSASVTWADVMDDIRKRGEMVVGMEVDNQPYEYFKDGEIIGYDVDLAKKLADKLGIKVKFVDTEWSGIIPSLLAKKFDLIFSGMTITGERAQKVNFSMPYAEATNVILVRADDNSIKTAEDIAGKRVGAQLSSAGDKVAKDYEEKLKKMGKPGYTDYKLYDHVPEAYVDLSNKRIDAVVNSLSLLIVLVDEQKGKYKLVSGIQDIKPYFGVALRKDDTDFLKIINEQFAAMKASGELAALQATWFGGTMDTPNEIPATLP